MSQKYFRLKNANIKFVIFKFRVYKCSTISSPWLYARFHCNVRKSKVNSHEDLFVVACDLIWKQSDARSIGQIVCNWLCRAKKPALSLYLANSLPNEETCNSLSGINFLITLCTFACFITLSALGTVSCTGKLKKRWLNLKRKKDMSYKRCGVKLSTHSRKRRTLHNSFAGMINDTAGVNFVITWERKRVTPDRKSVV